MRDDILKNIIAEWLEERRLPDLTDRDTPPVQVPRLKEVLAVVGPRRAGKTFFLYQLIRRLEASGATREDILFIDFEDYRLADFTTYDIDRLLAAFHQVAGRPPSYLFFDEVQHLPRWSRVLRTLHNQGRYRIVVSGSNSDLLPRQVAAELRGRYRSILMLPFSFPEFLRIRKLTPTDRTLRTPARGKVIGLFDEFLRHGGFPEVIQRETKKEKRELLQNYYHAMFYRDIIERYRIRSPGILESMMAYCLDTQSELFSISRFTGHLHRNSLPASKKTVSNYLQYLRDAFFLILHEKFSFSPRKRIMNPKKVYLLDQGFAALGVPFSENRGKVLENVVAVELHRRGIEAFYFLKRRECDFILKRGTRPAEAIQVCWELKDSNRDRELQGLREAAESLNLKKAAILTYNQEDRAAAGKLPVSITPVWKWLLQSN